MNVMKIIANVNIANSQILLTRSIQQHYKKLHDETEVALRRCSILRCYIQMLYSLNLQALGLFSHDF